MESRVIFSNEELRDAFRNLQNSDERLFKEILNALESIKHNAFSGRNVKKNLIPKPLI